MNKFILMITIAITMFSMSCDNEPLGTDDKQLFNVIFERFNINNDGNSSGNGNFFYEIKIMNRNSKTFKTEKDELCVVSLAKENAVSRGSGEPLTIDQTIQDARAYKDSFEKIQIVINFYERLSNNTTRTAATQTVVFDSPWGNISKDSRTTQLITSGGTYDISLTYKIIMK